MRLVVHSYLVKTTQCDQYRSCYSFMTAHLSSVIRWPKTARAGHYY